MNEDLDDKTLSALDDKIKSMVEAELKVILKSVRTVVRDIKRIPIDALCYLVKNNISVIQQARALDFKNFDEICAEDTTKKRTKRGKPGACKGEEVFSMLTIDGVAAKWLAKIDHLIKAHVTRNDNPSYNAWSGAVDKSVSDAVTHIQGYINVFSTNYVDVEDTVTKKPIKNSYVFKSLIYYVKRGFVLPVDERVNMVLLGCGKKFYANLFFRSSIHTT